MAELDMLQRDLVILQHQHELAILQLGRVIVVLQVNLLLTCCLLGITECLLAILILHLVIIYDLGRPYLEPIARRLHQVAGLSDLLEEEGTCVRDRLEAELETTRCHGSRYLHFLRCTEAVFRRKEIDRLKRDGPDLRLVLLSPYLWNSDASWRERDISDPTSPKFNFLRQFRGAKGTGSKQLATSTGALELGGGRSGGDGP
ncbi:hypothetical protein GGR56DRAFT_691575 [Xylariaceae sp. FL0804]|nr:hypothetical protein GGR56DRAFT_691575 [Xylariaceae sp. FL0804]